MLTQAPVIPRAKIAAPRMGLMNQNENFEDIWSVLQEAINMIYNDRVSELSFERLYSLVYVLVLRRNGPKLYDSLHEVISGHFNKVRNTFDGLKGIACLKLLCERWQQEQVYLKHISDIFIYMDMVYSKRENQLEVADLGARLFLKDIVKPLKSELLHAMVQELDNARVDENTYCEFETLKASVSVLNTLEIKEGSSSEFLTEFEPVLLAETESFYNRLLGQMNSLSCKDFRVFKDIMLRENRVLSKIFDDKDTISKIYTITERVIVSYNIKSLAESCLPSMVSSNDTKSFLALVTLPSSSSDKTVIFKELATLIRKDLLSIAVDASAKKRSVASQTWMNSFIHESEKYEILGMNLEADRSESMKFIGEAIGNVINQTSYFSEFLSLFMDNYLKSNPTGLNADIEKCIYFFKLSRDKDSFELFYRQQLSKRLLQQKSNRIIEEQVIKLLQEDVGASFTSKLRGMIRDLNSSDIFLKKNKKALLPPFKMNVNVLTPMFWPLQNIDLNKDITLPEEIEHLKSVFEQCYLKNHSGRLLKWGFHLSTVEVAYRFKNSYHELSMTMFSAMVFLLFKESERLTFEEIQDKTKIPAQELVKHLISLSIAPKTRVLNKTPPGRSISPSDVFSINHEFSAPEQKVKVLMVVMNPRSNTAESSKVFADKKRQDSRVALLNSQIIRIMKSARKVDHLTLQTQVTENISTFQVNSTLFKISIEYLLRNEYLKRDADDPALYHYLP